MKIEKKIWPEYFQAVADGKKKFELRLADFDVQEGDILLLREWDPQNESYTGREMEREVSFVIKTKDLNFWSQAEIDKYGFQIISLR
ncbi:MAG: hypothetical protein BWY51_00176 [Parcubacteria group bacterium ADurb.Bin316]|nr:MAG: hypothetical protein BWY51_00176 [Parcubacteria group bacterium ADurb.Bin316]HOZ56179.1 DUF3850 domain-containing protein [bacterium]